MIADRQTHTHTHTDTFITILRAPYRGRSSEIRVNCTGFRYEASMRLAVANGASNLHWRLSIAVLQTASFDVSQISARAVS